MQEELLTFEREFTRAVAANDVAAIARFVADDWVIVDADGGVIDRSRFLNVIESGALSHESMESADFEVRLHGDTAVVTGITTSKGQFMGQGLHHAGASHRCPCTPGRPLAVRLLPAHSSRVGVIGGTQSQQQIDWSDWLRRWDAQQEGYVPEREARFTAMFDVLAELLPTSFVALDLACGPGSISQRLLTRFPKRMRSLWTSIR